MRHPQWTSGGLAHTFHGLTPRRAGIFLLAMLLIAPTKPTVIAVVMNGGGAEAFLRAATRPFIYLVLNYGCVLLAVIAAENRGARHGWRRGLHLFLAAVVGQALGYVLFFLLVQVLDPATPGLDWARARGNPLALVGRLASTMLSDLTLSLAAVLFWYFLRRDLDARDALRQAQLRNETVERETAEARFAMMQAQIEPHFLFNSLGSIRRLYAIDAHAGRSMLQHLTRYLTASLPLLRQSRSTLGRELALALAYLNVQKIRMGPRLTVSVRVPGALHGITVPTMMLATLVENAVLHGLTPLPEGGSIIIAARRDDTDLVVDVIDDGRGLADTAWGGGVGLANIRARLASAYGTRGGLALDTNAHGAGVTASLRIPLDAPAAAGSDA